MTVRLEMSSPTSAALALADIKLAAAHHPGPHELLVVVGGFTLALGPDWHVDGSEDLLAALGELGDATLDDSGPTQA